MVPSPDDDNATLGPDEDSGGGASVTGLEEVVGNDADRCRTPLCALEVVEEEEDTDEEEEEEDDEARDEVGASPRALPGAVESSRIL